MSNKIKNGFGITAMSAMATVMATMPIYATSNDEKSFTGKDEGIVAPLPPEYEEPKDEPVLPKMPYFVIFKDSDGTYLKSEVVRAGESATPPTINNDAFIGWSGDYTNINSNITLIAQYKKFYGKDEGIVAPEAPEFEDVGDEPVLPPKPVEPTLKKTESMKTQSFLEILNTNSDDDKHFNGKDEGVTPPTPESPDEPNEPTVPDIPEKPVEPDVPVDTESPDDKDFNGKDEGVTPPTPESPNDSNEPTVPVVPEKPVEPDYPIVSDTANKPVTENVSKSEYSKSSQNDTKAEIIPTGINDELREHSLRYFLILAPVLIALSTLAINFKKNNCAKENK